MTKRAVAYLRVSSQNQANSERWGLSRQQQDIARYARAHELQIAETFQDSITGSMTTRKGLTELKRHCASANVQVVIISSIDRLAREVSASYKLLAEFIEQGLEVHSADHGPIDLSVEESTINFSLRTLFSHLERNAITRRTRAARMAMAENNKLPTGIRNYGYRNGNGKAIIHPVEAATVRKIFEAAASGDTHKMIAASLERAGVKTQTGTVWHKQTISGMIKNEVYKGTFHWGRFEIPVPPIVAPELWAKAQPPRRGPRPSHDFPLLGHIRCGVCGRRMSSRVRKRRTQNTEYYRCNGQGLPQGSCNAREVRRDYIEPAAAELVSVTLADADLLSGVVGAHASASTPPTAQLEEIEAEDARWLDAFRLGAITPAELAAYRQALAARRRALEAPQPKPGIDLSDYAKALLDMPLAEALDASSLVIVATNDSCRLSYEPRG